MSGRDQWRQDKLEAMELRNISLVAAALAEGRPVRELGSRFRPITDRLQTDSPEWQARWK